MFMLFLKISATAYRLHCVDVIYRDLLINRRDYDERALRAAELNRYCTRRLRQLSTPRREGLQYRAFFSSLAALNHRVIDRATARGRDVSESCDNIASLRSDVPKESFFPTSLRTTIFGLW